MNALIFDYGFARPTRLYQAVAQITGAPRLSSSAHDIRGSDILILPSAPDDEMTLSQGMRPEALDAIGRHIDSGRPVLAVGFGALLLLSSRAHAEMPPGLEVFDAPVARFDPRMVDEYDRPLKTPHIGYSYVVGLDRHPALGGFIPEGELGAWFYFSHHLLAPARVPFAEVAVAHHGVPFAGAVWRENVTALGFLPELSGPIGLALLERLLKRSWKASTS